MPAFLLLLLLLLLLLSSYVQLSALPQLLQWLSAQNDDSSNELLHSRLDMARVAVAGHSRGGKLAALQFAQGAR
jgi:predicted dienelactone hydrolase